ncbi:MAG: DMT family transporter [Acuticoccus sp.]
MSGRVAASAVGLGLIGMVMFAGTLPATVLALDGFGPVFIAAGRAVVAAALSGALLVVTRQRWPRGREIGQLVLIAACLVIGFPLFSGLAMQTVGAGHGGVVLAIMPLATAIAGAVVGGERLPPAFWALSVCGAAIVSVFTLSRAGWSLSPGDGFLVIAAALAGLGYATSGVMARSRPGWSVTAWALVISLPFTIPVSAMSMPAVWPQSGAAVAGFAYLAIVSMFLGFVFWNVAMAMGGIAKVGQIQLLQPFVTIAMAAVVTHETLNAVELAFAAAVVVVVAAAQRVRVREAPAAIAPAESGERASAVR